MAFKLALCLVVLMSFLARISARRTTAMSLFVSGGTGGFFLGSTKTNSAPAADSLRMSSSVATTNPLVVKGPLPKFDEIAPIHVLEAVTSDLDKLKEEFTRLEAELAGKKPDYALVVEQMEKIQAPLGFSWGVTGHLMGVKNGDDLRKAHDEIQPDVVKTSQQLGQSKVVYQALKALREDTAAWDKLEEAQQRIVASALRGMVHSGVGLEDAQREHFNKLQLELAELSTKFSNNVLDSTKAFKLRLTDAKDVEGLPTSALELAAQRAKTEGDAEATAAAGPWVVTLDMPSYLPAMQHLKNRDIREKLYRAYATRASSGDNDNALVITRILTIKRELAQMLGYKSIAEKSLASKMAPSVDAVMQLTDMLQAKAYPAAQKELVELQAYAQSKGFSGELALWDVPYWSERLREAQYDFKEEDLRPYFPLPKVLDGLFSLAHKLFGVTIEAADGDAPVWHPDVRFFKVSDATTGEHIANFYLDPYSRPAEKRGGAWMDVCVGRSKVMNRKPVAYLVCNGSPPVGDKPSLMTFREVETLFHEAGHGLQHMLTRVEHGDAAGINNVEWDAVELPSQFMENWVYHQPTLYGFAKHYETGEPMPLELYNKVKAAKNFQAGLQLLRQLFFGAMDMELHSANFDPTSSKTAYDVQHELAKKYTIIPPLPNDRFLNSFGHIFAGGYSAGYYSYKWAEVMSADAFSAFEEVGLDNEKEVEKTGRRFRETVLALGGAKAPADVYKAFRGRDPSPEALLRHAGLA